MAVSEVSAKLKARLWLAVAQSGVDVSGLGQGEMDKLVGAITEGVLLELEEVLSETSGRPSSRTAAQESADEDEEVLLWEGRPFMSLSVQYQITSERVRVVEGMLGKQRDDIELVLIQDVDHKQNLSERLLNIGDIYIRSHDPSYPEVTLNNVTNPVEVHELLRRAILRARKKYNLSYRQEM
jgi:hypothetical protein